MATIEVEPPTGESANDPVDKVGSIEYADAHSDGLLVPPLITSKSSDEDDDSKTADMLLTTPRIKAELKAMSESGIGNIDEAKPPTWTEIIGLLATPLYSALPLSLLLCFYLIRCNGWILYLFLLFLTYTLFIQDFQNTGGFPLPFYRKSFAFRNFVKYFPIEVEKMADLDPSKNYIFGYHPHGIIGMGAQGVFATDATRFSKLFPGIMPRLLTLDLNFRIPFFSLLLGAQGVCSASKYIKNIFFHLIP